MSFDRVHLPRFHGPIENGPSFAKSTTRQFEENPQQREPPAAYFAVSCGFS